MLHTKRWMKLLHAAKRKSFFRRLIVTIVLITLLPNVAAAFFSYVHMKQNVEEETGNNKLQYLNQTINAFELILNRIQENSNLLVWNRAFRTFEHFPNGQYYENLHGALPKEDLTALYSYLNAKKNAFMTIDSFKLSNEFVDSVYFYDGVKDLVITSDHEGHNRQYALANFYDKGWIDDFRKIPFNPIILDTRAAPRGSGNGEEKQVVSLLYKSNNDRNAVIVNLDADQIHREIFTKLNQKDEMYVVSSSGSMVYASTGTGEGEVSYWRGDLGGSGSYIMSGKDGRKLVSYSTSPMLDWTFINVSDMNVFTQGLAAVKKTVVWSILILSLLSVVLAYLTSKRLYQPISYLNALTANKNNAEQDAKVERTDEIQLIGHFVKMTINERNFYKEKLEEALPLQRERFKQMLLQPNPWTLEEIEEKIEYLGLNIETNDLVVLLLDLGEDYGRSPGQDWQVLEVNKLKIRNIIDQFQAISTKHFLMDIGSDKIAIVLNRCGQDQQHIFRFGQNFLDVLNQQMQSQFTIGAGRSCSSITELPRAFEEAKEALKYQIWFGRGCLISVDDIVFDNGEKFVYPRQQEEKLLEMIRTARQEEALQMFDEIATEIEAQKHKLHYNQIQPIFIQLLNGIIHLFNQLGVDLNGIREWEKDPYRELLDQDTVDNIREWFQDLIRKSTQHIEQELSRKGNHHIAKVLEIIEQEYDKDLSLNSVAEKLNLNPVYISRLFKQSTGRLFVDYLKQIRIDRSKSLLTEGNLKINEVGKQVGFGTTHYYIKVFKEMTGLTPGEYKKINNS